MTTYPQSQTRRKHYSRQHRPFRWSRGKRQLLEFVGAFRFLTDKECLPYWGTKRERQVEKMLASLYDAGYLDRVEVGLNEPIPYHLTPKGATESGFKLPKYIPHTVREHELFIAFIGITLAKILGSCTYPKRPINYLKPDALIFHRAYRIFIEADCHSENESQWREKLENYRLAVKTGRLSDDLAKVRIVVAVGYKREGRSNRQRMQDLIRWTADYTRSTELNLKNLFYFVTEDELEFNSFQVPEFNREVPLVPGTLADVRDVS